MPEDCSEELPFRACAKYASGLSYQFMKPKKSADTAEANLKSEKPEVITTTKAAKTKKAKKEALVQQVKSKKR